MPKLIVSGAVLESRWPSWAVRPNEPSGFRGCKFTEPCFGISHSLSLICQLTSEDIKHHFIIIITNAEYSFTSTETRRLGRTDSPGRPPRLSLTQLLNYEREYQKQSRELYIGSTGPCGGSGTTNWYCGSKHNLPRCRPARGTRMAGQ